MVFHAALMAAQPNSSLNAPSMAFPAYDGQQWQHSSVCSKPSLWADVAGRHAAAVGGAFRRRNRLGDLCSFGFLPSRIPSSARVHASGLSCALRQARSSASAARPFGLRFPASPDPP